MKAKIYILGLFILFFSCKNQIKEQSVNKKKNNTLITNKWPNQGECFDNIKFYKPNEEYEFVKTNIYRKKSDSTHYFLTCRYDGLAYLNQLDSSVDIESLTDHGEFWTDKNYVYYEYSISDGVLLYRLDSVDRKTFKSFGKTIYGRDRNHIYDSRNGIVTEADLETFHPIAINPETGISSYGKDKKNYFFWNKIVEDTLELKKYLKIK